MHQPATPTKGAAAEKLTKTIDHFSARWGLLLPRQDAQWSPSKNPHEQCIEEKIVARIKFLIFKNQNALENALEGFEQSAMLISKGWKFKPKADDGVLPLRESATGSSLAGGGGFLRRTAVDPHIINELMESLFSFVDQAAERVKKNLDQGTSNDGAAKGWFCSDSIVHIFLRILMSLQWLILEPLLFQHPKYLLRFPTYHKIRTRALSLGPSRRNGMGPNRRNNLFPIGT